MPDEFLTIEQVAQRLALPPEMIRRRIESGDIPVHWVEAEGKLEMRVAQEDISSGAAADTGYSAGSPLSGPYGAAPSSDLGSSAPTPTDAPAPQWPDTAGSEYPQGLWTPADEMEAPEPSPWDAGSEEMPLTEPEGATVPVWRPDPATWEDEPLEEEALAGELHRTAAEVQFGSGAEDQSLETPTPQEAGEERGEVVAAWADQPVFEAFPPDGSPIAEASPSEEEVVEPEEGLPAPPAFGVPPEPVFDYGSEAVEPEEEPTTATADWAAAGPATPAFVAPPAPGFDYGSEYGEEEQHEALEEEPLPIPPAADRPAPASEPAPVPTEDVAPPSAMVSASGAGAGSLAINSIDARELVAGLFERWERALEQRIQAEQRLRFEAELEQRMRQVRDLRQELDQTRQAQAAELAEREREVMELRNRVRELEQAPRGRGLFRR